MNDPHAPPPPRSAGSPGVVALSWYEIEETCPATDQLWRRLAARLRSAGVRHVPAHLSRGQDTLALLRRPDLLLTQTCGMVAGGIARDLVRIVATPCYDAPGCEGGSYTSVVLVRAALEARGIEELRGTRLAVSDPLAHSGCNAIRSLVAHLHRGGRFFAGITVTGSHVNSIACIAGGAADVAAVDCVSHEVVRRFRPQLLAGTRVIGRTAPAPAPPFVTAAATDDGVLACLREALADVIRDPAFGELEEATLLADVTRVPDRDYERLPAAASEALALGYTELAFGDQAPGS